MDAKPAKDRAPANRSLSVVMLAAALSAFLPMTGVVANAEAILIAWTIAFVLDYWVPPKPTVGFLRWTGEHIAMLVVFYLLVLKAPPRLLSSLNRYVAFAFALVLFIGIYFVWTRHPKSTLRFGGA